MAAAPSRLLARLPCAQRRRLLRRAAAAAFASASGLAASPAARATARDGADAFAAENFADAIRALGGAPVPSSGITLGAPAVADNGALVPITVSSALPGTREILVLVDTNPQPAAVRFTIPHGTEPYVATRIRMAGSGTVYAAVRTEQGLFAAACAIEVTVGGCG